jgi:hypothetical protein
VFSIAPGKSRVAVEMSVIFGSSRMLTVVLGTSKELGRSANLKSLGGHKCRA